MTLPVEEDYGTILIQAVDDFYLELYAKRVKELAKRKV